MGSHRREATTSDRTGAHIAANARRPGRWLLALALLACLAAVIALLGANAHEAADALLRSRAWVGANVPLAALLYSLIYVAFAALSLPGAWALSVAGGALFGPWLGVPLVSVSSTAGAVVAMLTARYLIRDFVERRFPEMVGRINRGLAKDGVRYLLAARLTPVIPFFAINLAMGLTRMPASVFALATWIGALPIVVIFVLSGAQFATISRPQDVLGPRILLTLLALAAAQFAFKAVGGWRETRARLKGGRNHAGSTTTASSSAPDRPDG